MVPREYNLEAVTHKVLPESGVHASNTGSTRRELGLPLTRKLIAALKLSIL